MSKPATQADCILCFVFTSAVVIACMISFEWKLDVQIAKLIQRLDAIEQKVSK